MAAESLVKCPICWSDVSDSLNECTYCNAPLVKEDIDTSLEDIEVKIGEIERKEKPAILKKREYVEEEPDKKTHIIPTTFTVRTIPPRFSAICSFVIPLFMLFFVGLEFFATLIIYPLTFTHSSLIYLTPYSYYSTYWLSAMAVSFLMVLTVFVLTLISFNFMPREKLLRMNRRPLLLAFLITLVLTLSLGYYVFVSGYYSGKILSFAMLSLFILTGFSQINILLTPETLLKNVVIVEEPDHQEGMDEAVTKAYESLERVKRYKIGVATITNMVNEIDVLVNHGNYIGSMEKIDEIGEHERHIKEVYLLLKDGKKMVKEAKKRELDHKAYLMEYRNAKKKADSGHYQEAISMIRSTTGDLTKKLDELRCPFCMEPISVSDVKCYMCGKSLVEEEVVKEEKEERVEQEVVSDEMPVQEIIKALNNMMEKLD